MKRSNSNQSELDLRAVPNPGTIPINGRCTLKIEGTVRVVYIAGLPMHHWTQGDRTAEAYAMVSLVRSGYADQNDVARSFGCSPRTLRRYQRCFETGGMSALGQPVGPPHGARSTPSPWVRTAKALRRAGVIVRDIAHRLGVSKSTVSKWLTRLDKPTATHSVADTAQDDEGSVVAAPSLDTDPKYRVLDRLLARLGKLEDAEPIFTPSRRIPSAGVLLAVPALTQSGIFSVAQEVYGHIGPAFYGLRTTMMALLLMALLRIKRPEGLKERAPVDLGRVLGLDRGPEVKTLRRKLAKLATYGRAEVFGHKLAQRRVARRGSAMGFLYMDGHVRVYHGNYRLTKAHVTQMRMSLPATTDYWVNDKHGDPLFVVTAEFNEGLVQTRL